MGVFCNLHSLEMLHPQLQYPKDLSLLWQVYPYRNSLILAFLQRRDNIVIFMHAALYTFPIINCILCLFTRYVINDTIFVQSGIDGLSIFQTTQLGSTSF